MLLVLAFFALILFTLTFVIFLLFFVFVLRLTNVLLLILLFRRVTRVFKEMEFLTNIFGLFQDLFLNKILDMASISSSL